MYETRSRRVKKHRQTNQSTKMDKETDEWSNGYKGVSKVVVDTTNRKRKQPTPENKINREGRKKETARKTGNNMVSDQALHHPS